MKSILLLFVLALPAIAADKEGYDSLFNGKNLDGWDGDPALWSVANGVIVGSSDNHPFTVNTFLVRTRTGEGRARAKARGVKLGRASKLTSHQQQEARARRANGEALSEIARTYNVSHSTISRLPA